MKITLTGSLGNISKPLATTLIAAGHEVTIVSSSTDKAKAIEELGAHAAIGSIEDVAFLTTAFRGADAVYTMVPPNFAAPDPVAFIASVGKKYAAAITASGIKKVVNLSSIGAHLDSGTGPIAGLYDVENSYASLNDVIVKHLRPAYFYTNLLANIDMIKHAGILGSNYSAESLMVIVHPKDIAAAAAEELQSEFFKSGIRYIASDEITAQELATALGTAVGKPELLWLEFSDEDALNGMVGAGLPEPMAKSYVEMGNAIKSQIMFEDYILNKPPVFGKVKLGDYAKEFAEAYNR